MPETITSPPTQQPMRAGTRAMPLQTRLIPVSTVDQAARTLELVWTTGAAVRRFDWASWSPYIEELSLDPAHIRMGRLESGAPLLNTHQQWDLESVIGVVERAWIAGGEGRAMVRFSQRDELAGLWRDVADGIVRNVSVGYIVHRYEKIDPPEAGGLPTWRAIDWEPTELSFVPVGADALAGSRGIQGQPDLPTELSADQRLQQQADLLRAHTASVGHRLYACELVDTRSPTPAAPAADITNLPQESDMPMDETVQARGASTATPAAGQDAGHTPPAVDAASVRADERSRIAAIRSAIAVARRSVHGVTGLDDAFETRAIENGLTVDQVRSEIFRALESHSSTTGPQRSAAAVQTVQDEQVQRIADMTVAVSHRANPSGVQLTDGARRFRGYSLFELARRSLELQGISTEGLARAEIVGMAMGSSDLRGARSLGGLHGTSDFAVALANTVNRSLRDGYTSAPRSFTRWARQGTLADFRPATRVAVAGNLSLEKVNQFGEFKRGRMVDAGETIQLATYGKVVGVSRQAVINDDLDMLGRIPAMFGRAAADFESDTVYGVLTANAAMSDGTALFHADHGNLAGTGAAISETTLSAARLALRRQTDPSGNGQPLNLVGRYIIVPAALETAAQKQISAVIVAAQTANTNVFQNAYEIVTEPRLDAASATAWYLAADGSQIDTIEYAYLEGEQGLYTEQRMGFDVDGLEVKARLDFAAKAVDWRGLYRNAGA